MLSRVPNFQTMKVEEQVGARRLHILIDPGSTHNLLDQEVGAKLCMMANGMELVYDTMSKAFGWKMQGDYYSTSILLLALGTYDMILGVQWLPMLGKTTWDFKELEMSF